MKRKLLLLLSFLIFSIYTQAQCTLTAVCPGGANWTLASSWTPSGCGAVTTPGNNMTIIIPSCATVLITNSINGTTYNSMTVIVQGNLNFSVGSHLNMDANSSITVQGTGTITGANAGDQINIGGTNVWTNAPTPIACCVTLGIELVKFNAIINNNQTELTWTTATETNNDFFTVEKSKDAINFEQVLTVNGAGNSTSLIDYFDVDPNPFTGISFYRLKQTDFNGNVSYSNIVPVEYNLKSATIVEKKVEKSVKLML